MSLDKSRPLPVLLLVSLGQADPGERGLGLSWSRNTYFWSNEQNLKNRDFNELVISSVAAKRLGKSTNVPEEMSLIRPRRSNGRQMRPEISDPGRDFSLIKIVTPDGDL